MPRLKQRDTQLSVTERWRTKISDSVMFDDLIKYCEGKLDMTTARANAILRIVGKILPDLQSVTVDVSVEHHDLNRLQLEGRLNALGINADKIWNQLNPNVIEHTNNNSCIDIHESEDTNESSVESESVEDNLIEGTTPMDDESES